MDLSYRRGTARRFNSVDF